MTDSLVANCDNHYKQQNEIMKVLMIKSWIKSSYVPGIYHLQR